MAHVCPWWAVPLTINPPFRRLLHDPDKIVGPYVKPGMIALDVGCGIGWFLIPMAKMVGENGQVIAVDLQPQMLTMLARRAEKAGVNNRIRTHQCEKNRLALDVEVDFALVFAMLHEVPDRNRMLSEIYQLSKPNGRLLLAEPPIHVTKKRFAIEVADAEEAGFRVVEEPHLRWSHAALLAK